MCLDRSATMCRGEVGALAVEGDDGRATQPVEPPSPPAATAGDDPTPATILLAEDDVAVRSLLARVLRRAGFDVVEAVDGVDALERWRAHAGSLNLVVTDVVMPRMAGPEMVRRLRQEQPTLRVLYVSGYTFGAILSDEAEFIAKPLHPAELVTRVRAILGEVAA